MRERLDYVDIAKGILISFVVIGHIWQAGFVHNLIYSFHMPAFFLISGILMSYTKSYEKQTRSFIGSKVYAYGIPFLWIEMLGVLTDIIRHGVTLNVKGYLYNTFSLHFNDHNLWFIVDLFILEVIFFILLKYVKTDYVIWIICGILWLVSTVIVTGITYMDTLAGSFRYMPFIAVGYYLDRHGFTYNESKSKYIIALISLILIFGITINFHKLTDRHLSLANIAFMISGFAGSYLVLMLGKLRIEIVNNRFLITAGKNTLIIYGTHHIIYAALGHLMGITDYSATPLLQGIVLLIGVCILEIPVIYTINRWFPFFVGKRVGFLLSGK